VVAWPPPRRGPLAAQLWLQLWLLMWLLLRARAS
jgi:hypothetical protein